MHYTSDEGWRSDQLKLKNIKNSVLWIKFAVYLNEKILSFILTLTALLFWSVCSWKFFCLLTFFSCVRERKNSDLLDITSNKSEIFSFSVWYHNTFYTNKIGLGCTFVSIFSGVYYTSIKCFKSQQVNLMVLIVITIDFEEQQNEHF